MKQNAVCAGISSTEFPPHLMPALSYETLKGMIAESHPATAEHSIRVRICAMRIGQAMRLGGLDLNILSIAAELHDIGKIYVPKHILDDAGALNECDWQLVRQHPLWGAATTERSFPYLPDVSACIKLHHERLDGSGYPYGVGGWGIPYLARIISVADAFAALTEDRPYRVAYNDSEALHILLVDEAGRYDEQVLSVLAGFLR